MCRRPTSSHRRCQTLRNCARRCHWQRISECSARINQTLVSDRRRECPQHRVTKTESAASDWKILVAPMSATYSATLLYRLRDVLSSVGSDSIMAISSVLGMVVSNMTSVRCIVLTAFAMAAVQSSVWCASMISAHNRFFCSSRCSTAAVPSGRDIQPLLLADRIAEADFLRKLQTFAFAGKTPRNIERPDRLTQRPKSFQREDRRWRVSGLNSSANKFVVCWM